MRDDMVEFKPLLAAAYDALALISLPNLPLDFLRDRLSLFRGGPALHIV